MRLHHFLLHKRIGHRQLFYFLPILRVCLSQQTRSQCNRMVGLNPSKEIGRRFCPFLRPPNRRFNDFLLLLVERNENSQLTDDSKNFWPPYTADIWVNRWHIYLFHISRENEKQLVSFNTLILILTALMCLWTYTSSDFQNTVWPS